MKRYAPLVFASLLLVFTVPTASLRAASSKSQKLSGTWTCIAHGGSQGDTPFTLYLQQDGTNVTGSVSSSLGDAPISSATFKGDVLEIEIDGSDTVYKLKANYLRGKLSGDWSNTDGEKGSWTGTKKSGEAQ
jgi:hypothetical protein